mgnify:CR=1 FL=1
MDFDPTLKKKKKKKVVLEDEDGVEAATENMDGLNVDDEGFGEKKKKKKSKDKDADADADADEDFGKKKKKKKKKDMDDEDDDEDDADEATNSGSGLPWDGSNREYHYDELLGRVFGILREKNPSLSEKTKTIIKPPQVLREGTKKTVFANLIEICNAMNRSPEHVIQYMMAELGTSGTLDGTQRLIIKGRFLPKVFEGVLRHYFIDYVICNLCKSANTTLDRDKATRLSICKCNACGASRSVSAIQKGFQAVQRGERRKARQAA